MISVAIIDNEVLVQRALTTILNSAEGIVVAGAASGHAALRLIDASKPDVILLDLEMPEVDGFAVLRHISERNIQSAVAILTTFGSTDRVRTALQMGARGYLLKDTDPDVLASHVRSLAAGAMLLTPAIGRVLISSRRSVTAQEALKLLSERELIVLRLLATGQTNNEIAAGLHLAPSTVKDHVSVILQKLHVTTRVHAALIAERGGIFDKTGS